MSNSLEGCVSSLRETMSLLHSSISTLDAGVNDFPRLGKVLQTTRHFELISESTLHTAQSSLLSEIRPEVTSLLSRVTTYLDKQERREQSLIAKYELQQGRLDQSSSLPSSSRPNSRSRSRQGGKSLGGAGASGGAGGNGTMSALEVMRMKQLRQKKERLSFAIDRLQLQASQRERQLRKSMAAQPQVDDDDF